MTKKVLKGIAVILALLVVAILFLYLNLSDPYGPLPGGRLQGEEVTEPVTDWSFVQQYRILTSEVRPSNPYSIHSAYVFHDGGIYLSSALGAQSRWSHFLLEDPDMRLRIGDQLYPVRATRIEDPALFDAIHDTRERTYPKFVLSHFTPPLSHCGAASVGPRSLFHISKAIFHSPSVSLVHRAR